MIGPSGGGGFVALWWVLLVVAGLLAAAAVLIVAFRAVAVERHGLWHRPVGWLLVGAMVFGGWYRVESEPRWHANSIVTYGLGVMGESGDREVQNRGVESRRYSCPDNGFRQNGELASRSVAFEFGEFDSDWVESDEPAVFLDSQIVEMNRIRDRLVEDGWNVMLTATWNIDRLSAMRVWGERDGAYLMMLAQAGQQSVAIQATGDDCLGVNIGGRAPTDPGRERVEEFSR